MNRHSQNSDHRNYYYLPPSTSSSSRNTYYQYYDPRLRTQQSYYSNTTSIPTYNSPNFQHQYQPSRSISDLTEPLSVFDDLKPPRYHRSNTNTFPLTYLPSNLSRRSSVSDARLATASAIREQLLTDIQRNITEIDRELTSLEQRPSVPPTPLIQHRISTFIQSRQTSSHQNTLPPNGNNQIWPNKPKRVYKVIPRITSESKKISQQSTPKLTHQTSSTHSFVGKFHYGAEMEENEILENDPENSDYRSIINQIPESSSHETFSLDEFIREQSPLPQNRALTFVPQYVDNSEIEINQSTEDIHQNNPVDMNTARSSTASSLHDFGASNKLNIQDFQSLIQTASQLTLETTSKNEGNHHKSSDTVEQDLANTMLSKPAKHSHMSTRIQQPLSISRQALSPSQQAIVESENNTTDDSRYFFSDFGNDGEGEEDVISIDPNHFALPTESEMISDENISIRQSQISLLNPYSSQQQQQRQSPVENNNAYVKERESKKIDATTKHTVNTTTTSPSTKIVPISIMDNMQTPFARNNNDVNQRQISPSMSNQNVNEQSAENSLNNYSIYLNSSSWTSERIKSDRTPSENMKSVDERPTSVSKKSHSTRQRSSSSRRSSKSSSSHILTRDRSINSADINKTPNQSGRSSALPVPLTSPTLQNARPPTSRTATPERKNSIPSLDQNIFLQSSNDIFSFDDSSVDYLGITSSQQLSTAPVTDGPTPLGHLDSFQKIQDDNQSNQNQDEIIYQSISPSISINMQDNDRTKTHSLLPLETKKSDHDYLRLPSISSHHSETSDANLTSVDREDTFRPSLSPNHHKNQSEEQPIQKEKHVSPPPPTEEEFPTITASQRRSKLSLLVRRPKTKQKKSITDQSSQTQTTTSSSTIIEKKPEHHRRVLFSDNIASFQIERASPLKPWRERIDTILEKKRFHGDKYAHIKSRVNTFDNFEYHPRKFMILSRNKPRTNMSSEKKKPKKHKQQIPSEGQRFGRIWRDPDGTPRIFHESLEWKSQSKVKSYSLENLNYKSRRKSSQIFNKKSESHSESKLAEPTKHTSQRENRLQTISLPIISDNDEPYLYQQQTETETKIFDVNSNSQHSLSKFQESIFGSTSFESKHSDKVIFDEKLLWTKKSKLKDSTWENIKYQPRKSQVQIFHQPVHWNRQLKMRNTPSSNLHTQTKVTHESEINPRQFPNNKALFAQSYDPKWSDITSDVNEENSNDKLLEESPANRPKWNSVSKTRSVNTFYNPKLSNTNLIRRGWDLEFRRKRVHKLPPLKRKRNHDEIQQLAIQAPPSNNLIAIDYTYDQSDFMNEHITSVDYATISSRRSSKALLPLRRVPELQLVSGTPRSQRPVQQEWYDELNKSRSTHRTDMGRITNNSFRDSNGSIHQTTTPRDFRSSTRNSQNSVISGTVLDSSIRTNRATELRLSRDMDEHHQHSHDPSQSMPIEIRGFRLEGTQLTVPDHATIRPLSNVNYRTSERVKSHRLYPWSHLHSYGTSSRNSSLLPIAEFRHPSFETSIIQIPQLVNEE